MHYAVYFFAGLGAGAAGLSEGALATDGALAKRWAFWLLAALISFATWIALTAVLSGQGTWIVLRILSHLWLAPVSHSPEVALLWCPLT